MPRPRDRGFLTLWLEKPHGQKPCRGYRLRLRGAHPSLTPEAAFSRSCRSMPLISPSGRLATLSVSKEPANRPPVQQLRLTCAKFLMPSYQDYEPGPSWCIVAKRREPKREFRFSCFRGLLMFARKRMTTVAVASVCPSTASGPQAESNGD